ncbi:transporter substrate-binding domain-containing protein [Symbiobacterium thermophilum]|uniref:Amino acid ABC transporter substrate-binding protein n=2 Tax=Symbiobacterium thermophilum TaxID=2734 RepID=Q67S68_SYMTH|nr:transporter substrate-binding domain-containing protein [Symbiobacterium thermophilum]MBY6276814.1 adhesin [Symbiobacterium thermophilum]BAD39475.1 amino acid ABC transporter substrate-binding protein [Symbiobacterium thermophilum IAM 14863]
MKRRWGATVAALLCAAVLAGCGGRSSAPAGGGAGGGASDLPAQVQKIRDAGVLRVGVKEDVPKFGYFDPAKNAHEGLEIDLARRIAKEIFGDESKVQFTGVNAKTRGPALDNGEIDLVIATFTITEERKKSWNFSDPYFTDYVGFLVLADSGIQSWKDLDGKVIGVAQSASTRAALTEQAEKDGIKVEFMEFATYPEIKAALDSRRIDAFSVDQSILWGYKDDKNVMLPDKFAPQEYGIATKLSNTELAEFVNNILKGMKESGELDQLYEKWGLK